MVKSPFRYLRRYVKRKNTLISALFTSVNSNGWNVTYSSPTEGSTFNVIRNGYDSNGNSTTFVDTLKLTKRVRQAYPSHASLTADIVSLSDYIYSGDSVVGAINNSTVSSPKPIVDWALPGGLIIGNTLRAELVAFHRDAKNGEPVACVEFIATDGSNTISVKVGSSSLLNHNIIGYAADIDVTSLSGTITLNAKVYPHIGTNIADSSLNSGQRHFAPRKYYKVSSVQYIYVASGGNNSTAVLSSNPSTAEATPASSVEGALVRAHTLKGNLNGVIIRVKAGTYTLSNSGLSSTLTLAEGAEVIVERDPNASIASVILQLPLIDFRPRLGTSGGQLRFKELTFNRTVNGGDFNGEATSFLTIVFDSITFNNNNYASAIYYPYCGGWWLGTNIIGGAAGFWGAGLRDHLAWRGCSGTVSGPEGHLLLGNDFTTLSGVAYGTKDPSGAIIAFNKFYQASGLISIAPTNATNIAIVQNLLEINSASAITGISINGVTTLDHVCIWHNTCTGFNTVGRNNLFYDESPGCVTRFVSMRGNIHSQLNEKNDVFISNSSFTGNFAYEHGVGCFGEFSQFMDANGTGIGGPFAQDYPGLDANIGTSNSVRNDPLFIDYKGVTSGPTGGAGNGNYRLQSGSPADDRLKNPCLKWDLAGVSRSLVATASGAYEL